MNERRRVTFVQTTIRQYRIPFFEVLRTELRGRGVDISVVHSTPSRDEDQRRDVAELSWGERTPVRRIGLGSKNLVWQTAPEIVWSSDLVVVEQATRLILNYRLMPRRHLGGPKVALWGHVVSPYWDANPTSERIKRWVSRQPDWWFAYTDGEAERLQDLGYPAERITSVRNATDTQRMIGHVAAVSDADVERTRREIGLQGEHVGLFLGALVSEKRLDHLVAAADIIRSEIPDFELMVSGDGDLAQWVREQARQRPWMHVLGQRFEQDLALVLSVSSMLLLPAWVGLVITDGLAAGRPLLTSRDAAHGPEIEYLRHGQNGLLIEDGRDPRRYAAGVVTALHEPGLLQRLQEGARADAQVYSAENMAQRFADGVLRALDTEPRRSRRIPTAGR
jgi:L-malate glycosyltransferase